MVGTSGLKRSRVSPLIVSLAAIAIALVVTEGYLLFRPHPPKTTAVVASVSPDDSEQKSIATPIASPEEPPTLAAVVPAMAAPVAPESPASEPPQAAAVLPPSEPPTPQAQHAAVKKRALL